MGFARIFGRLDGLLTTVVPDVVGDAIAAVLPGVCPCGAPGEPCCARCAAALLPAPFAPPPPGVDWWVAPYAYAGIARELVARAKYRNERAAIVWLAAAIARGCPLGSPSAPAIDVDVVTWAPASWRRQRANGVDHAALLARAVARKLDRRVAGLLVRDHGAAQTGRGREERRSGPALTVRSRVEGRRVLVVDDVATTGATLAAAARALRSRGAVSVAAATATRTPLPGDG